MSQLDRQIPTKETQPSLKSKEAPKTTEESRAERVSALEESLNRYDVPKNSKALEDVIGGIHEKYAHAGEGLTLSEESRRKLDENRQQEIAAAQQRLLNYQKQRQEVDDVQFVNLLRPTNFDAKNVRLWSIEGDRSKLVRESIPKDGQSLDQLEKSLREGQELFAHMRDKYGINIVSMNIRRGKNKEGNDAILTIVDTIEGKTLSNVQQLPMEAKEELETLYVSLGKHYHDAWR